MENRFFFKIPHASYLIDMNGKTVKEKDIDAFTAAIDEAVEEAEEELNKEVETNKVENGSNGYSTIEDQDEEEEEDSSFLSESASKQTISSSKNEKTSTNIKSTNKSKSTEIISFADEFDDDYEDAYEGQAYKGDDIQPSYDFLKFLFCIIMIFAVLYYAWTKK